VEESEYTEEEKKGEGEMKHGVNPTREQKIRLRSLRLDPKNWMVIKDGPSCFEIMHRVSGKTRKLEAVGGRTHG